MNTAPKKLEALKERHARTTVKVRYDPETHEVRIALPDTLDGSLFGGGGLHARSPARQDQPGQAARA